MLLLLALIFVSITHFVASRASQVCSGARVASALSLTLTLALGGGGGALLAERGRRRRRLLMSVGKQTREAIVDSCVTL